MSSESEIRRDGVFTDTVIMCPDYEDEVSIRLGDKKGWRAFPGNDWVAILTKYNPRRVIINPYWRHRIGTILDICDQMPGGWLQLCPPGDMYRVYDDVPARGGPININVRMKVCLHYALQAEHGKYDVGLSHPLRPIFDWGLFQHQDLAAKALLWIIDPRLFINPEDPEKGWKRRVQKAMGIGLPFRAVRRMFKQGCPAKFEDLHRAWSSCAVTDIPSHIPAESPARWLYDFYLKTRANLVDRKGDVKTLNRFAAIVTCRRLVNFICESWVFCMYSGNYPILCLKDYVEDIGHRGRIDNLLGSYCEQLDGCHTAG